MGGRTSRSRISVREIVKEYQKLMARLSAPGLIPSLSCCSSKSSTSSSSSGRSGSCLQCSVSTMRYAGTSYEAGVPAFVSIGGRWPTKSNRSAKWEKEKKKLLECTRQQNAINVVCVIYLGHRLEGLPLPHARTREKASVSS